MSAVSLKLKYASAAFLGVLAAALVLAGLFAVKQFHESHELAALASRAQEPAAQALAARMAKSSEEDFRTALGLAGALALLGGLGGAALAWRAGRKLEQPIVALIKSAERI
ncbi:MAG: hypothetical protein ACREUG_09870, partial [Steroidobacteraceae bacterium]